MTVRSCARARPRACPASLAPIGDRAEIRPGDRRPQPAPDCGRHLGRAEAALERVRRHEHRGGDAGDRAHAASIRHPVRRWPRYELIEAAGIEVRISNPEKVFFPERGITKLDLVRYYLELSDAVINHLHDRPTVLKRFVDGAAGKPFFQKRVPDSAPEWLQTATVHFPSGRTARELVPNDAAHLVWGVNLGVIDWNPWPVTTADLDHPDELRVDLDPTPEASWDDVRRVALVAGEVLTDHGLIGFPKTSGSAESTSTCASWPSTTSSRSGAPRSRSRGRWSGGLPPWPPASGGRRSATECSWTTTRTPATGRWPRPTACARCPMRESRRPCDGTRSPTWSPAELRLDTVPGLVARRGDPSADIDQHAGSLHSLLELARRDEEAGLGDAPWPPHFAKQRGEPKRVQPSRARKADPRIGSGCICPSRQSRGALSSRQRRMRVPWRIRPSLAWSNVTSTTSSGRREIHSRSFSLFQRLGSPCPRSPVCRERASPRACASRPPAGPRSARPRAAFPAGHRDPGSAIRPCPPPSRA